MVMMMLLTADIIYAAWTLILASFHIEDAADILTELLPTE